MFEEIEENIEEIKEFARKKMQKIDKETMVEGYVGDVEEWHIEADKLLCEVLKMCGFRELAKWFESHEKWYA